MTVTGSGSDADAGAGAYAEGRRLQCQCNGKDKVDEDDDLHQKRLPAVGSGRLASFEHALPMAMPLFVVFTTAFVLNAHCTANTNNIITIYALFAVLKTSKKVQKHLRASTNY